MRRIFLLISMAYFFVACAPEKRPNIIFLLTDDQRWDAVGYAGNDIIKTPNMDKLASEGVMFRNAFVTTPICAVSRASILSGQYSRKHGIHGFATHFSDSAYQLTYPMQLKEAGYKIGFIGKYGIGKGQDYPADQYDYWKCFPRQGKYWHKSEGGGDVHLTTIMGDQAIEFLNMDFKDSSFCLSVSFKAPHVQDIDPRQFLYDSAYIDLYKDVKIPVPQTADSSNWESFPEFFKTNNEARRRWAMRFSTPEKFQTSVKGYYRLIYGIDVVLGRIRESLIEKKLEQNTVIMLMGDNGFYLADHGLAGKWYAHEESIRVPFIVYDPRLPDAYRGQTLEQMALNIDVAPTILDFAGLPIPNVMQGKSILPLLSGSNTEWRDSFLFEHLFVHKRIPSSEGIIKMDQKYVRFLVDEPQREWLFDLSDNPQETINFADSSEYASMKKQLIVETEALIKKMSK